MGLDMSFFLLSKGTDSSPILQLRNAWHIHDRFWLSCNEWDIISPELITSFCQEVRPLLDTRIINPDIIDPPSDDDEETILLWWERLEEAYNVFKDVDEELLYYGWV